jgi:capsular polysaccharide export protein
MLITFSKEISKIIFLESFLNEKVNLYSKKINLSEITGVIGWGIKTTSAKARKFASKNGIPYISLEDGFVCSYGLRIKGYPPLSLIVDKVGIYYNAKSPSMLEEILNFHNFTHEELKEGQKALEIVLDKKISKS